MPKLLLALGSMLLELVGSMAGRALIGLGIGAVTYTGLSTTMGWIKGQAIGAFLGLGPQVVGMLGLLKVGVCLNIIFSALLVPALINGVSGDSFKRWVIK